MDAFLASDAAVGLERAIVCEPTGCRVGVRHRGIGAAKVSLGGPGGHSSLVDGLVNPVAVLARAAVALDEMGIAHRGKGPAGFPGINLNVAALEGGIAFNVVPTRATLSFSLRPAPGANIDELFAEAEQRVRAAAAPHAIEWTLVKASLPFATRDLAGVRPFLGERLRDAPSTWGSGPRRRASPSMGSTRWSSVPATSGRRTPPTSSSPSPISRPRAPPSRRCSR